MVQRKSKSLIRAVATASRIDTARNTITIKAAQDIIIEAAQGTIKLDAQNVEIVSSAATGVQAKGGLTLDGSPGNTTIKGTTVNIN